MKLLPVRIDTLTFRSESGDGRPNRHGDIDADVRSRPQTDTDP